MSEQETEGDVLHWVESLRDRVSRVSGRPGNSSDSRFNSVLKGELLDAIDLLLQQVSGIDPPPDPVSVAADQCSQRIGEILDNLQQGLHNGINDSLAKSQAAVERAQELCRQLEDNRTAHAQELQELTDWIESRLRRQQADDETSQQIVDQFRASSSTLHGIVESLETAQAQLQSKLESMASSDKRNEELQLELERAQRRVAELEENLREVQSLSQASDSQGCEESRDQRLDAAWQQLEDERKFLALRSEELDQQQRAMEQSANTQTAELMDTIAEMQRKLDEAALSQEPGDELLLHDLDQARREIRALKEQNSELRDRIAKQAAANHGAAGTDASQQENLSWEDRKRLMLQQMESDDQGHLPQPKRLEIERVIAETDQALQEKERQLRELQRLLDEERLQSVEQSSHRQLIDNDELIQQEREKLRMMQGEWEEKLRKAEIDLSIERAKLARERSELEQELSNLRSSPTETPAETCDPNKGRKRKWLDHLGLRDDSRNKDG
ncbi:MAG: hypothetical protein NXI32_17495 [bacterium]|nr:hypothetical protein [bacterium]